jgi:hypothetical protein
MLVFTEEAALVAVNVRIDNSTIIPPCWRRCVFNQFYQGNVSLGKGMPYKTIKISLFKRIGSTSVMPI